jgi:hypothetical protein
VKPGEFTNQGNGINICNSLSEIKNLINQSSGRHTYIIQKYIDKPLLYHKRKFDLRCFALFTSINGWMKGYFFEDGYIRTSSKEYSLNNLSSRVTHLTNDAIQVNSDDYGKFESGNKTSFGEF